MNNLESMLVSAHFNFEPEDVAVAEQAEAHLMQQHGAETLRRLGPGTCAALLAIASMWHSFPANAHTEDYTVNFQSLSRAAHLILTSGYQTRHDFPYTRDELYDGLQHCRRQAYEGNYDPLVAIMEAALQAIADSRKAMHSTENSDPQANKATPESDGIDTSTGATTQAGVIRNDHC